MNHVTTVELLAAAAQKLDAEPPPFAQALCGEVAPRDQLTANPARADCPRCLQLVADPEDEPAVAITTWRAAAAALGVSEDTVARRRRAGDPERRCYFRDENELVEWWRTVDRAAKPAPRRGGRSRKRRGAAAEAGGPVDWTKLANELTHREDDES